MKHSVYVPKDQILSWLTREIGENTEKCDIYHYLDSETGRRFRICYFRDRNPGYLLEEFIPHAIWDRYAFKTAHAELFERLMHETSPNTLLQRFLDEIPDSDRFELYRFSTAIHNKTSIYYDSLEDCASRISQALLEDEYYLAYDPDYTEPSDRRRELERALAYWSKPLQTFWRARRQPGFFRYLHDQFGNPLAKETKKLLLSYVNHPDPETWELIYGVFITTQTVIGCAWIEHAGACGKSDAEMPSGSDLIFVIQEAARRELRNVLERRRDLKRQLRNLSAG